MVKAIKSGRRTGGVEDPFQSYTGLLVEDTYIDDVLSRWTLQLRRMRTIFSLARQPLRLFSYRTLRSPRYARRKDKLGCARRHATCDQLSAIDFFLPAFTIHLCISQSSWRCGAGLFT